MIALAHFRTDRTEPLPGREVRGKGFAPWITVARIPTRSMVESVVPNAPGMRV